MSKEEGWLSILQAARIYAVLNTTLCNRMHGRRHRHCTTIEKQGLTLEAEEPIEELSRGSL